MDDDAEQHQFPRDGEIKPMVREWALQHRQTVRPVIVGLED